MTGARSLEERIDALESEREIRELLIHYAMRLDARDHGGYARLFARDGEWSGRMGQAKGPAAIEKMLEDGFGPTPAGFANTNNFHLMTNMVVKVDGDRATAVSRLTYFERAPGNVPVAKLAGRYEDELVREDGRWLFRRRKVIGEIPTIADLEASE
ncbi:MAG: nuclear transport factor 2 family protein [Sphingomonas sp.]